jgi:hypothetical protein
MCCGHITSKRSATVTVGHPTDRRDPFCRLCSFRRSAMERLVSYHCAQRRYLSAMLFHAALFSLLRRKLAI